MNILIVYNSSFPLSTSLLSSTGLGGTETNIIQLSQKFSEKANVTLACAHSYDLFYDNDVRNIQLESLEDDLKRNKYDFILIQCFYRDVVKIIEKTQPKTNVFIFHSLNWINQHSGLFDNNDGHSIMSDYLKDEELRSSIVKKFIALSESQKNEFQWYNHIPEEMIEVIPNGVDFRIFDNILNVNRVQHSIIWSSNISRGLGILVNDILPLVKHKYNDVILKIACPAYAYRKIAISDQLKDSIEILGPLSKTDLYQEIKKSQVWFYPSTFNETFCITAAEMALGEVELILPLKNGPATIFKNFPEIGMHYDVHQPKEFILEAVERICSAFEHFNDNDKIAKRKEIADNVRKTCSYDEICNQYFQLLSKCTQ